MRKDADYVPASWPPFDAEAKAQQAIQNATAALSLLGALDADLARRTAAVAAIRAAFP